MLLSFGDHLLQLNEWRSEIEMSSFLDECELGRLELGEALYSGANFFSLTVLQNNQRLGIGLSVDKTGLRPGLLLDLEKLNLILGFGQTLKIVDVDRKTIIAQSDLNSLFYQFWSLHHLGINHFFLAQQELELTAFSYDGTKLWEYIADDVISSLSVKAMEITIRLLDSPEQSIHLNLQDGTEKLK